jgi:hypothetical protein
MNKRLLLSFGISFAILGFGSFTKLQFANAAPAPIFQPLIRDIRNQLPRGMIMRLPAFLPPSSTKLYPSIDSGDGYFTVVLGSQPGCNFNACLTGSISVARPNSDPGNDWQNGTPVTLGSRIRGFYSSYSTMSGGETRSITWEQNGMIFDVSSRLMSRRQLIDIATSMTNEPPISGQSKRI